MADDLERRVRKLERQLKKHDEKIKGAVWLALMALILALVLGTVVAEKKR